MQHHVKESNHPTKDQLAVSEADTKVICELFYLARENCSVFTYISTTEYDILEVRFIFLLNKSARVDPKTTCYYGTLLTNHKSYLRKQI